MNRLARTSVGQPENTTKDVSLALELAEQTGVDLNGFAGIADLWLSKSGDIPDTADFNEITKYGAGK